MNYQYKIQWLFPVNGNFVTPTAQLRKELYQMIRILGARSLTKIVFRDADLKVVSQYSSMVMYPSVTANKETIKAIKKAIAKNENITQVELLRK